MVLLGLAHGQVFDGPPISLFKLFITHESKFVPSYLDISDLHYIRAVHDGALDCRPHEYSIPTEGRV